MKELLKAMLTIKRAGPKCELVGICSNVVFYCSEPHGAGWGADIQRLAMTWPYYSGNIWYPVPHPDSMGHAKSAQFIYNGTDPLWDASLPYGRLRWKLVDWLIYKLEQEEASDANP